MFDFKTKMLITLISKVIHIQQASYPQLSTFIHKGFNIKKPAS